MSLLQVPKDILRYLYHNYLSLGDGLALWKSCKFFYRFLLRILRARRFTHCGWELTFKPDHGRVLTSFFRMKTKGTILPTGKYSLGHSLYLKESTPFFYIRGVVIFNQNKQTIDIERGSLFELDGELWCVSLMVNALTLGYVIAVYRDYSDRRFISQMVDYKYQDILPAYYENKDNVAIISVIQGMFSSARVTINTPLRSYPNGHIGMVGPVGCTGHTEHTKMTLNSRGHLRSSFPAKGKTKQEMRFQKRQQHSHQKR